MQHFPLRNPLDTVPLFTTYDCTSTLFQIKLWSDCSVACAYQWNVMIGYRLTVVQHSSLCTLFWHWETCSYSGKIQNFKNVEMATTFLLYSTVVKVVISKPKWAPYSAWSWSIQNRAGKNVHFPERKLVSNFQQWLTESFVHNTVYTHSLISPNLPNISGLPVKYITVLLYQNISLKDSANYPAFVTFGQWSQSNYLEAWIINEATNVKIVLHCSIFLYQPLIFVFCSQVHFNNKATLIICPEPSHLIDEIKSTRRGPWLDYARDRCRFQHRIQHLEKMIGPCLSEEHRKKITESRQLNDRNDSTGSSM